MLYHNNYCTLSLLYNISDYNINISYYIIYDTMLSLYLPWVFLRIIITSNI